MKLTLLVLALATSCLAKSPVRFDNYQVHRVTPQTPEQLEALRQIEQHNPGYNFWTDVADVGKFVDIMVPPHLKYDFEDLVQLQNLDSTLSIENVQKLMDEEKPSETNRSSTFNWTRYQSLNEIYNWLTSLAAAYPSTVSTVVGGQTYEERQILGIKISFKSGNRGVFLEGGIHAREWIAPATVTFIVNQLLTSNDPQVRAIAENYDWYVFPVVNPDGYVYTHTYNRVWRKTRTPYGFCYGADPNRNWGYYWNQGGVTHNPCDDTYAGPSAFSEIETYSLAGYISSIANKLHVYLGFHSYSQFLLIPFGHQGLEVPANNAELHAVGRNAMNVLARRYGTQYKVGNIPEIIYVASGGSSDWVLGSYRRIRFVFTYELRDTGRHGFLLPPEQIIPTGLETLDSVVSILEQAATLSDTPIAPATVTFIVNQLLTSKDSQVRAIAENYDWYVFPVVNPEGYVYTHTSNRLWRKTRTPYGLCYGADPNRNWDYHWNEGGVTHSPCLETYAGPSAFSEIETYSLAGYISSIANKLHVYLGFHSYGQDLLIPFSHRGLEVPANNAELHAVGRNATKVLARRYGTQYRVGNIPEIMYVASGGSSDWVLGNYRHIRFVYTYELRDVGRHGFLLPPEQIIPTGLETFDSVVSILQQADTLFDAP